MIQTAVDITAGGAPHSCSFITIRWTESVIASTIASPWPLLPK